MTPSEWNAEALLGRLERRDAFFILDVRGREEFERFHIEGAPILNVPYFEMVEPGAGDDGPEESVVRHIDRKLRDRLPSDVPVLAVCNKGFTSEVVARALDILGYDSATLKGGMRGWGDHYAIHAIVDRPDLAILQISRPARGCLSYIAASAGKAIVIDPLRHLEPYLGSARAAGVTIAAVIDTHGHADHVSGAVALAARTGAPYYLHPHDAVHPVDLLPASIPFEFLREGQTFRLGRHEVKVLHVPGHTLGMVALQLDDGYLFSGDSIFIRSVSRPDLGGKAESWAPLHARSLRRLLGLPGEILVLPGHFSGLDEADGAGRFAAPLETLKRSNDGLIVLQRETEAGFVRYLLGNLPRFNPEYVEIKRVNAGLSEPPNGDASALEIGKNACAILKEAA